MSKSSAVAALAQSPIAPPEYRRPPVHEVALSLVFVTPASTRELEQLPGSLRDRFPMVERQERVELEMTAGAAQQILSSARTFDGWRFTDASGTRVVFAAHSRASFHAVRPGQWPTGDYAGWPAIYREALALLTSFAPLYGQLNIERAGLRYLNRIAVPVGSRLEDWFNIGFTAPPLLRDTYAMNLRQTWGRIEGHDDLSATIGLATIEIPDPSVRLGHVGFLLDIEVFNLWKPLAPKFLQLRDWCRRAHDVEREIFEFSITDLLRQRFEVISK